MILLKRSYYPGKTFSIWKKVVRLPGGHFLVYLSVPKLWITSSTPKHREAFERVDGDIRDNGKDSCWWGGEQQEVGKGREAQKGLEEETWVEILFKNGP